MDTFKMIMQNSQTENNQEAEDEKRENDKVKKEKQKILREGEIMKILKLR